MDVADADRVIRDLQAKRDAIIARRKAIDGEVQTISYAALAEHDKAASARLAKLNIELATLTTDALDSALVEAGRRQTKAKLTEAAVLEAERQIELQRLAEEHRKLGREADSTLETLIETLAKRRAIQDRMRRLGNGRSAELSGVSDKRAIETGLMQLGQPFLPIEPSMRITFAEIDDRSAPRRQAA